jgi:hypothetical protein
MKIFRHVSRYRLKTLVRSNLQKAIGCVCTNTMTPGVMQKVLWKIHRHNFRHLCFNNTAMVNFMILAFFFSLLRHRIQIDESGVGGKRDGKAQEKQKLFRHNKNIHLKKEKRLSTMKRTK